MLIAFILAGMLLSPLALALADLRPYPIAVKVSSNIPMSQGIEVIIMDVNTGASKTLVTNGYGEILIDAADFGTFSSTDTFRATVVACSSNPTCKQEAVLGDSIFFQFDLDKQYCFDCPTCPTCEVCPVIESCLDQGYILPSSCQSCTECTTCPDTDWYKQIETIISVIVAAAVGAGVGLRITKTGTKTHYHPGRRDYHSPDIMHASPYTHKKGETFPKYERGSDGRWRYVGG